MNSMPLEITVKSAEILKNVSFFNRKRVYTVVSLIGSSAICKQRTNVDERNGSKPFWGLTMKFHVEKSKMHENSCMLVFQVRCRRTLGDKDLGFLYLPVKELFDGVSGQSHPRDIACMVTAQSGKPKGILYLTYKFEERVFTSNTSSSAIRVFKSIGEDVTKYPVPSAPPCYLLDC